MKYNTLFLIVAILSTASCRNEPSTLVAEVGGIAIHASEVEEALSRKLRRAGDGPDPGAVKEQILDELIRGRVILARARAAGYESDPDVIRRFEQMLVAQYEQDRMPDLDGLPAPTPGEIQAYYEDHAREFRAPTQVRAALIHLRGSPKATLEKQKELRERADEILAQARKATGKDFGDLARRHSDHRPTRYLGGDCGWIKRSKQAYSWPDPVTDAIFALETPGELGPVISGDGSCYLLKLIERKPAHIRPLEAVRDRIRYLLAQQQREQAVAQFHQQERASVPVNVNRDVLAQVRIPAPNPNAMARNENAPPTLPQR